MIRLPKFFKRANPSPTQMLKRTYAMENLERRILLSAVPISADIVEQGTYAQSLSVVITKENSGDGEISITTGADGSTVGHVVLGQAYSNTTIDASNADGVANTLVINAGNGGILDVYSEIGRTTPLDGLTVTAKSAYFTENVKIQGDLVLNVTEEVRFSKGVTILGGGNLIINGAVNVTFSTDLGYITLGGQVGTNSGDLFIQADNLTLPVGGAGTGEIASVAGATATFLTKTAGRSINLASPQSALSGALNLTLAEMQKLSTNFSQVVIGDQSAPSGTVLLGADDGGVSVFRSDVVIYADDVVVDDFNNVSKYFSSDFDVNIQADASVTIKGMMWMPDSDLVLHAGTSISQIDSGSDGRTKEAIVAKGFVSDAQSGVSLPWLDVNALTVTNGTISGGTGAIDLGVVGVAGDSTDVLGVSQMYEYNAGAVSLVSTAADLVIKGTGSGVRTAGAGTLTVSSGGALTIEDTTGAFMVQARAGDVSLSAKEALSVGTADTGDVIQTLGAGSVSLTSTAGAITLTDGLSSQGGSLTLRAQTSLTSSALSALGAISVTATTGTITLNGTVASSGAGVSLTSGGSISMQLIEAAGDVSIEAEGAIDSQLADGVLSIDAATHHLLLDAVGGVASATKALHTQVASMSARNTTTGGIFVTEADGLILSAMNGVDSAAVTSSGDEGQVVVTTLIAGDLHVEAGVELDATLGEVRLHAGAGHLVVNAAVSSDHGNASLIASGNIDFGALGAVFVNDENVAKTVELLAQGGTIAMAAGAIISTQSSGGNVRLRAQGDVTLANIDAGAGVIAIASDTGRVDQAIGLSGEALIAASARIEAATGIGSGTPPGVPITVGVDVLAAVTDTGGIFVNDADGIGVASVAAVSVNAVDNKGVATAHSAGAALSGIDAGAGSIVVSVDSGDIQLDADVGVTVGAGHVLLQASAGALEVNAGVSAADGSVSLLSLGSQSYGVAGSVSASAGIDVQATGSANTDSDVSMVAGTVWTTQGGAIRVAADRSVSLGVLDARVSSDRTGETVLAQSSWGAVSVVAGGAITDVADSDVMNVYAGDLRMSAGASVGEVGNALEVEAATLGVEAGTLLRVVEDSAVTVAAKAVGYARVLSTGVVDASLSDVALNAGLSASGTLQLDAAGAVTLNASVTGTGSGESLSLKGAAVSMADGVSVSTNDGDIRLEASSGDVLVETVSTDGAGASVTANVALLATAGRVGDLDADSLITASGLLVSAGSGVGVNVAGVVNALNTSVDTLAVLSTAGSVYVDEVNGLTVGDVAVSVDRGGVPVDVALEDASVTNAGSLVLVSALGDLVLNAGALGGAAVEVGGTGHVLLQASAGALEVNAGVSAADGSVSLLSLGSQSYGVAGSVSASAGIDVQATGSANADSDVSMVAGTVWTTQGGAIRVAADRSVSLGVLDARVSSDRTGETVLAQSSWGAVSVVAGGADISAVASSAAVDVYASELRLSAGGAVGSSDSPLRVETRVAAVAAQTAGAQLVDGTDLTLDAVAVSYSRVGVDAVASVLSDVAMGLAWSAGGDSRLTVSRDLTLSDDIAGTGGAKTLDFAAKNVVMNIGVVLQTNDGAVRLEALDGDVVLHEVSTDGAAADVSANVAVIASGAISGTGPNGLIVANGVLLQAGTGIGQSDNAINTSAHVLAARADSAGIYVSESNGITVDTVTVDVVRADVNISESLDDVVVSDSGDLVLTVLNGDLIVKAGAAGSGISVTGVGSMRLDAVAGSVDLQAAAQTADGALTIVAGQDIDLGGVASIVRSTSAQDIALIAQGDVTMASAASVRTAKGGISIQAGADLGLARLDANVDPMTGGRIALIVGGVISDTNGGTDNLIAKSGLIQSGGGAGAASDSLETRLSYLSVQSGGGQYVYQKGDLMIEAVAMAFETVSSDGSVHATTPVAQSDLKSVSGDVVLRVSTGDLVLNDGADVGAPSDGVVVSAGGTGRVFISTTQSGSIAVNSDVRSAGGLVTLAAQEDVIIGADTALDVDVEALGAGDVSVVSEDGSVYMGADASVLSATANVYLEAQNGLSVTSVSGSGISLVSMSGSVTQPAGLIKALDLKIKSAGSVGSSEAALSTDVERLSVRASGVDAAGLYLHEANDLDISTVAVPFVEAQFNATMSNKQVADGGLSGVEVSGVGDIEIVSQGDMTFSQALSHLGTGLTSLSSEAGSVVLNALLRVEANDLEITALGSLTGGAGKVDVRAGHLSVDAGGGVGSDGAWLLTEIDDLSLQLGADAFISDGVGDVTLVAVSAPSVAVNLLSVGAILTSSDNGTIVHAGHFSLSAATGIGGTTGLAISADTVSVDTLAGNISLRDDQGDLEVLHASAPGDINIAASSGSLTVTAAAGSDGEITAANLQLDAKNAVTIDGDVSVTGEASFDARAVAFGAAGTLVNPSAQAVTLKGKGSQTIVLGAVAQDGELALTDVFVNAVSASSTKPVLIGDGLSSVVVSGAVKLDQAVTIQAVDLSFAQGSELTLSDAAEIQVFGSIAFDGVVRGAALNLVADSMVMSPAAELAVTGALTLKTTAGLTLGKVSAVGQKVSITDSGAEAVFAGQIQGQTIDVVAQKVSMSADASLVSTGAMTLKTTAGMTLGNVSALGQAVSITDSGSEAVFAGQVQGQTIDVVAQKVSMSADASLVSTGAMTLQTTAGMTLGNVSALGQAISITDSGSEAIFAGQIQSQTIGVVAQKMSMSADATLVSTGAMTLQTAAGMTLGRLEAVGQTVTLDDGGSLIQSVADMVNIEADTVLMSGWGPAIGLSETPLKVDATHVQVYSPSGMVLRDTSADGHVTFLVINGDQIQRQVTNVHREVVVTGASVAAIVTSPAKAVVIQATGAPVAMASLRTEPRTSAITLQLTQAAQVPNLADVGWGKAVALADSHDLSGGAGVADIEAYRVKDSATGLAFDSLSSSGVIATDPNAALAASSSYAYWTDALSM